MKTTVDKGQEVHLFWAEAYSCFSLSILLGMDMKYFASPTPIPPPRTHSDYIKDLESQGKSKSWSIWNTVVESCKGGHSRKSLEPGLNHEKAWYNCRGCQSWPTMWERAPRAMQWGCPAKSMSHDTVSVFCGTILNPFVHNYFIPQQQVPWLWDKVGLRVQCRKTKSGGYLLLLPSCQD